MTEHSLPPDNETLDRYLAGALDAPAAERVERWVASGEGRVEVLEALRVSAGGEGCNAPVTTEDGIRELWERLDRRGERGTSVVPGVRGVGRRGFLHGPLRRGAGAILLAAVATVIAFVGTSVLKPGRETATHTYATTTGQRATISLLDGTRVTLAPRSTLGVTSEFGHGTRGVTLTGEAYFEVSNAIGAPFVVRTGDISTRVLGTTFDVRRYTADTRVRVAVTIGKVVVINSTSMRPLATISSGAVGVITHTAANVTSADSARDYMAWTEGTLVFRYASTAEVLETLTRWYGYEFRLADSSLATRHLTAGFSLKSSTAALANLKTLLNVDLTFDGNVVTLHSRHRAPDPSVDAQRFQQTLSTPYTEAGR